MDGVSSAAAIVPLAQLAGQLVIVVGQYASSVKNAESSRQRLLQELFAIGGIMNTVKTLVDNSSSASNPSRTSSRVKHLSSLFSADGPLVPLQDTLTTLLDELNKDITQQTKFGSVKKLVWPFKEKTINNFITSLERYKSILTLAFSTDTSYVTIIFHLFRRSGGDDMYTSDQILDLKDVAIDLREKLNQFTVDIAHIVEEQQIVKGNVVEILNEQKRDKVERKHQGDGAFSDQAFDSTVHF
jgi:hypothetical protein